VLLAHFLKGKEALKMTTIVKDVGLKNVSLSPRDLNNVTVLKHHGLSLVEVKISQVSFAKGMLLGNVPLPENTRITCVLRHGNPIVELDAVFLEEGDLVYLITDNERSVRTAFTVL
jgi:NhaP-type Na+/H+ and K+/H+ antiporter